MINLTISVASLILSVLGVVLVLHFSRQRFLCYDIISRSQFDLIKRDDRITATFEGKDVKGVIKHVIFLWNPSVSEIDSSKVSSNEPVAIRFSLDSIVLIENVSIVGAVEGVSVELLKHGEAVLNFDNFDTASAICVNITELIKTRGELVTPKLSGRIYGGYDKIIKAPSKNPFRILNSDWSWLIFTVMVAFFSFANIIDPQEGAVSKYDVYMIVILNATVLAAFFLNIKRIVSYIRFRPPVGMLDQ